LRMQSMKTEAGRKKKIETLVEMLRRGETIHPQGKPKATPLRKRKASQP
jgi:hypothetical protein